MLVCCGAAWAAACASTPDLPVARPLAETTAQFLLPPDAGYAERLDEAARSVLRGAHSALLERGDTGAARAAAASLLQERPRLVPAAVLLGELEIVAGEPELAVRRLEPIVQLYPDYDAANLALARAAELLNQPVDAYRFYLAVADHPAASARLEALRDAALQTVAVRLDRALEQYRGAEGRELLAVLEEWAPDDPITVNGRRAVAEFEGDRPAELEALRGLAALVPERPIEQVVRQAELEVEIGDPQAAVALYQDMVRRFPEDEDLAEGLADARFRWRLATLPTEVGELFEQPQLTRGDFATILYWLVPGVRSSHSGAGTIVGDVPADHPQRDAIVRVVNLGLLSLEDATLHRFAADRPLQRRVAFETSLRLAAAADPPAPCAAAIGVNPSPSARRICDLARTCGLIDPEQACLPAAPIEGAVARRLLRRTLDLVGGR